MKQRKSCERKGKKKENPKDETRERKGKQKRSNLKAAL